MYPWRAGRIAAGEFLPALIAVHILTGFLGSGKTTLLNRALRVGFGADTAVIVNEFGDVGLDEFFVQSRSEETIVLKSGCICCRLRGDLPSALLELVGMQRQPLRRIVIETSGISEPVPILQTLRSDFSLRTRFEAGAIICTVGAIDGAVADDRPEARAQITAADALVITKTDLADESQLPALQRALACLNPLADLLVGPEPNLVGWVLGHEAGAHRHIRLPKRSSPRLTPGGDAHAVRSVVIRAAAPPSWPQFAVWLTRLVHLHGDRILRIKGLLHDADRGVWIGVHGVKRFVHPPVHLLPAAPPADGTCLVFITEGLDPAPIAESYRRLLADGPR